MKKIYILSYNNYLNRRLKGESKHLVSDFTPVLTRTDVNFDEKDGVRTALTLNLGESETFAGDYLITSADGVNVDSKWFIIEAKWNRKGQLLLELRRDVLADKFADYKDAPMYVEKGLPDSASDPLVYNSEGAQFNQILQSRTPLKQTNGQSKRYIVGYVDKTWAGGHVYKEALPVVKSISDAPLYSQYAGDSHVFASSPEYYALLRVGYRLTHITPGFSSYDRVHPRLDAEGESGSAGGIASGVFAKYVFETNDLLFDPQQAALDISAYAQSEPGLLARAKSALSAKGISYTEASAYEGERFVLDGRVYEVSLVSSLDRINEFSDMSVSDTEAFIEAVRDSVPTITINDGDESPAQFRFGMAFTEYKVVYTDVGSAHDIDLTGTRTHTEAPYDIFVIEESDDARDFASYFASQYAGGNVLYDVQLLPYSPIIDSTNPVVIDANTTLYWATSVKNEFSLVHPAIATYSTMSQKKLGSNLDMCRLVSPDGSSSWEFNPAQIGGVAANSIKALCTFMPYRPVIRIVPTFGGIYGSYNRTSGSISGEARGLHITGSFSIPYSTDSWATYKLNNASYMDAFNRQMENMSITQGYQHTQDVLAAISGVVSSAGAGAQMGALAGAGGVAAGIGAGVVSAIAGVADVEMRDKLRAENMSFSRDMFGFSLRNIQAQANPLAATDSDAIGNSYFPVIEFYTSTSDESDILKERLYWNGYSIGAIYSFSEMKSRAGNDSHFIAGRLIRYNGDEDAHMVSEIYSELLKGVYVGERTGIV